MPGRSSERAGPPSHSGGTGGSGPDATLRTRGLALARRIDRTRDLLRQARRRIKRSDRKGRAKALKQIKRMKTLLDSMEQDALGQGVSKAFQTDARRLLADADDVIDRLVQKSTLKKRHLRRMRKDLKDVRRRIEALLTVRVEGPSTPPAPRLVEAATGPEPRPDDSPAES